MKKHIDVLKEMESELSLLSDKKSLDRKNAIQYVLSCIESDEKWMEYEGVENLRVKDWSKIGIGTKVDVRPELKPKYFLRYDYEEGKIYTCETKAGCFKGCKTQEWNEDSALLWSEGSSPIRKFN